MELLKKKNAYTIIRRIFFVCLALAAGGFYLGSFAFTGPTGPGGTGSGAIGSDNNNNVSFGTSTTSNTTKLLIVASSTASDNYALRIIQPGGTSLLSVQNDGAVSVPGTFTAGTFTGTTSAGNVSAGAFGANTGGGNFSFPASLSVSTTTAPSGGVAFFNGNVGIGTSSPTVTLDIADVGSPRVRITQKTVNNQVVLQADNNAGFVGTTSNNDFSLITNGSSRIAILASNGNVGIGTGLTNPTSTLTVVGEIKSTSGGFRFPDGTLQASAGAASLWNASGTAIYNNNSGNVGIGTTSPGGQLSVVNSSASQIGFILRNAASQTGDIFEIQNSAGSPTIMTVNGSNGNAFFGFNVGIGTTNPTSTLTVAGEIKSTTGGVRFPDGTLQTTGYAGGSQIITAGNISSGAFGANTGGGNYSFPANLSVGTSTAASRLFVNGGYITVQNGSSNQVYLDADVTGGYLQSNGTSPLRLYSGSTEGMRILNSGNVGIGTTAPATYLHLKGQNVNYRGQLTLESTDYSQITLYGGATTATNIGTQFYFDVVNGLTILQGYNGINTTASTVAINPGGGNVGIGMTSPSATLHVTQATPATVSLYNGTSQQSALTVAGGTGGATTNAGYNNGTGGSISLVAGAGGSSAQAYASSGGDVTIAAGTGGVVSSISSGGNLTLSAGSTGALMGGYPGNVTIQGGNVNGVYYSGGTVTIAAGSIPNSNSYAAATVVIAGGAGSTGVGGAVTIRGGLGGNGTYGSLLLEPSGGNVGIGIAPSYQLQLSTDSAAKPGTNTWTISSDARLKNVNGSYTDGLNVITKLNPITYHYNGLAGLPTSTEYVGIIAQDVQKIPELAKYTIGTYEAKLHPEDTQTTQLLSFNGSAVTFAQINAIKELNAKVDAQQKEIDELKAQIQSLKEGQGNSAPARMNSAQSAAPSFIDRIVSALISLTLPFRAMLALASS